PSALARDSFKICWSIYVGWMPWAFGAEQGIVRHSAHPERIELFFTGSIIVSFQPRKDTHGISPRYGFNGYSRALQQ
ncbi:MAG: hypothetical protein KDJ99_22835, partial [Candidatus Competibacteraceae bacterium]|nr:hypothetical protein [Candidatus Competibacteraceae bacterium]